MSSCIPIKENISVYEGDDCQLEFTSNVGDITGYKVKLQARIDTDSRYSIIDTDGVIKDAATGVYYVTLPSASTLGKGQEKAYYYDIKLTDSQGYVHTDRAGMMTIEPRTTDLLTTQTVSIYGVDVEKEGQVVRTAARDINFKGNGVIVSSNGGGVDVEIDKSATAPTLALHFSGIYDTLQDLTDAIKTPTDNMQAIVIQPSEKYYHGVGGSWIELAPVGAFHSKYLGAYDTVDDLKAAEPSPQDDSLAIIGTAAKTFYIYDGSDWVEVSHTDLPTLAAGVQDNKKRIDVAEGHIQTLQSATGKNTNDIGALYAPDKATFDAKVESHLTQPKSDISALQAKTQQLSAADGVLQSNIDQKISGIHLEDYENNAFDDITGITFMGAIVSDDQSTGSAKVTISPKVTVANGQEPGSTSLTGNALIFPDATITADPNDANVLIIGRTDTPKFDPSMFQSAVDHGYAADDQGIKSSKTTDGWWIFKDLKSVGARPSGSVGDLFVFRNNIDVGNIALKHAFIMAIGQDTDLENKVWFMYRDGLNWTPWFGEQGSDQDTIDRLTASVGELKKGNQAVIDEVSKLQTAAGKLYAPTKDVFDKAVNALITAALKDYVPKSGGHGGDKPTVTYPRFYAQFINTVPADFTSATTSTNSEATLIRIPTTQSRIFISVENDNNEASKVKGFKFNNKLEMKLDHRDIVVQGKKYRSFYTSGAFTESSIDIKVDFGQGI